MNQSQFLHADFRAMTSWLPFSFLLTLALFSRARMTFRIRFTARLFLNASQFATPQNPTRQDLTRQTSATQAANLRSETSRDGTSRDETSRDETSGTAHDRVLVERCRGGDAHSFDEIVSRHQNAIYSLCFYHLRDADDAADAAQTTFVRAWRGLQNFRGESALKTWLHRIALNVVHDIGAKRGKTPLPMSSLSTRCENDDDAALPEAVDETPLPQERAHSKARRQKVREALCELAPNHRDVLVLFDVQGHSYEEVAAILEVPTGTVKSRLNRARLALRQQLEPDRELFED